MLSNSAMMLTSRWLREAPVARRAPARVRPAPVDPVQYDNGAIRFYHVKHGATICASGPGDITGGAFLLDNLGHDPAHRWSFGRAKPDGNFEILRDGTPFGSYTGLMVRMNNGSPVIHQKGGQVVYGTPIQPGDKAAHLT